MSEDIKRQTELGIYLEPMNPGVKTTIVNNALSTLLEAENIVNGERATDYGSAVESFERISALAELMLDKEEWESLKSGSIPATAVCKIMMAVKLARQSNKHKRDNLVDLEGYAELLNRIEDDNVRRAE